MKKHICFLIVSTILIGFNINVFGQTLFKHDFNDGNIEPFYEYAGNGNHAKVVNNRLETHWGENNYVSSWHKKAEFRVTKENFNFTKELWMGFNFEVGADYMIDNTNTDASILQLFGFDDAQSRFGPSAMIKYDSRNGGALTWFHWIDDDQATKKNHLVHANFPRNTIVPIVLHVVLSKNNTGIVEIWTDGIKRLSLTGQNLGWGDINADGQFNQSYTTITVGQYNYRTFDANDNTWDVNNHRFSGYLENETRTLTYDDVALYNGPDGYTLVDPSNETSGCLKTTEKTEAECYDSMSGIQTQESSEGTDNVGWIENGDWMAYTALDLTGKYSVEARVATANIGGSLEVRLGSETGTLIGSLDIQNTGGNQTYETVNVNINKVEGIHDVYLVCTGGDGYLYNVNWFGFSDEVVCNNTITLLEAECYNEMSGIQSEECSEGGKNVGYIQNGDWMMYENIDLSGMNSIKARVSGNSTGSIIEVRIDSEDGGLIAEIPVSNTAGNQNWVTDSINITNTSGVHDVYLVSKGGDGYLFNINHFGFSEEETVVTSLSSKETRKEHSIYPNPASDQISIVGDLKAWTIFDVTGNQIMFGANERIDVSLIENGIYILEINNLERHLFMKE